MMTKQQVLDLIADAKNLRRRQRECLKQKKQLDREIERIDSQLELVDGAVVVDGSPIIVDDDGSGLVEVYPVANRGRVFAYVLARPDGSGIWDVKGYLGAAAAATLDEGRKTRRQAVEAAKKFVAARC